MFPDGTLANRFQAKIKILVTVGIKLGLQCPLQTLLVSFLNMSVIDDWLHYRWNMLFAPNIAGFVTFSFRFLSFLFVCSIGMLLRIGLLWR